MFKQKPPSKIEVTISRLKDGGYIIKWINVSFTNLFRNYQKQAFTTREEMLNKVDQILATL
jgi:hypothetical protein